MNTREVYCEDVFKWFELNRKHYTNYSIVASLPDISEFPEFDLVAWQGWFVNTAKYLIDHTPDEGVTIFYQSDIKKDGIWVNKGYLCQKAAEQSNASELWHKIICKAPPGMITKGAPAYSHVVCFSKKLRLNDLSKTSADVIPKMGDKTWQRGIGIVPASMIIKFIKDNTSSNTIINPFCGEGSILAMANAYGVNAVGIERSPKRVKKAINLKVSSELTKWM